MKILRREVKEGQDDKVIPSGSRFDLSNSYDEQEKSNGDRMIDNDSTSYVRVNFKVSCETVNSRKGYAYNYALPTLSKAFALSTLSGEVAEP
ncbi:hypothetical protein ALC53_09177 [Atta colombica]|uniref:Uncharacterized protein n=1 Tax=Atta colombica TaxID=520822 RepID=A0A195B6D7_9HYME|nr:hypothetical protein ALC53_09177 [Atta colombica]